MGLLMGKVIRYTDKRVKNAIFKEKLRPLVSEFLESLTFISDKEQEKPLRRVFEVWQNNESKHDVDPKILHLYQESPTELNINGYERELSLILEEADHPVTDSILNAITALVIKFSTTNHKRIDILEAMMSAIVEVDLQCYFVGPYRVRGYETEVFSIKIGPIALNRLQSRCHRAKSDFYERHEGELRERLALEFPENKTKCINLKKILRDIHRDSTFIKCYENYFEKLAQSVIDQCWDNFTNAQLFAYPFGKEVIAPAFFEGMTTVPGSQHIYIFLDFNNKGNGFVGSYGYIPILEKTDFPTAIKEFEKFCKETKTAEVKKSALNSKLHTFCTLHKEAMILNDRGRYSDAAIYACIGLEFLFTEKKDTSEAICTRTAALVHKDLGLTFAEAHKELLRLYGVRSCFVHQGQIIHRRDAARLIEYSRDVIAVLLRYALEVKAGQDDFWEKWLKELDYIVAGYRAGKL